LSTLILEDVRSAERRAILLWARAVAGDANVVYLDTETTGINDGAEIVDIAVLAANGQVLLESLVRPQRPIPRDASRIHGILDEHVALAPKWKSVYPALLHTIAYRRVVVYNADYDQRVISMVCRSAGLKLPLSNWDCAMKAFASFRGEPSPYRREGYRWFKLDEAAQYFGIAPGGHRAAADAEACRQVVMALAALGA
jgi:DNA polymerase III subunit epsilon